MTDLSDYDSLLHSVPSVPQRTLQGARLYADRLEALPSLPRGGTVAEVGVAFGDFSQELMRHLRPEKFIGIDRFGLERVEHLWGRPMEHYLHGATHADFYRGRLSELGTQYGCAVEVREGDSWEQLGLVADELDVIYVDAGHETEDVQRDARAAVDRLAPGGIIVFNDYCWRDAFTGSYFGVVPVVNELLAGGGWTVDYLALHPQLFCDIAVKRSDA
jgi:hypothetical protein